MRTLESIQMTVVALAVFLPVVLGTRLAVGRMGVVLVLAMTAQLVFEGYRWQLLPVEIATLGLAVGDIVWAERRVRGVGRLRRLILGLFGVGLVVALPLAFPIPELPRPIGGFGIGTRTYVIVDEDRPEQYGQPETSPDTTPSPDLGSADGQEEETTGEPRRLVVQAWYPASVEVETPRVPWNVDFDVVAPATARRIGLPSFVFSHTEGVASNAVQDAAPLSGRLPVVVYSHGWTGFRGIALDQIEALASSGFVVIAADHTYGSIVTRFPDDGIVVALDERALPDEAVVGQTAYDAASEQLVETFADDIVTVIDAVFEGTEGPFGDLASSIDTSSFGVYGHSTGGGAALSVCLVDVRCRAVVGLDAWVEPVSDELVAEDLLAPSMFLRSAEWIGTPNDQRLRGIAERSPAVSYFGAIPDARHNDFTLAPLFSPIGARIGVTGPIGAETIQTIVNERLVAFFGRYLLDLGGSILDEPPPPELRMEIIP